MASSTIRGALKQLCMELSWSYATFWKPIALSNPKHLICEDIYYEQKSDSLGELGCQQLDKLSVMINMLIASKVYAVGYGLIGEAASSGNIRWVIHDMHNGFGSVAKVFPEINDQLIAGIKTIAVIPVLPFGVVQLGSTQAVLENIGFVNHVNALFMQVVFRSGVLPSYHQKGSICPSSGMLISDSQFEDDINKSNQSSISPNGCKLRLKEPSLFEARSEPWSLLSTSLQNVCSRVGEQINSSISMPCEPPSVSRQHFHSYDNLDLSEISRSNQLINKVVGSLSNMRSTKEDNELFQSSSIATFESDGDPGLLPDHQKLLLSSSNPVHDDHRFQNAVMKRNNTSLLPMEYSARDNDLFDVVGLDCKEKYITHGLVHDNSSYCCMANVDTSVCQPLFDSCSNFGSLDGDVSSSGVSFITSDDQLLDAVISKVNLQARHELVDGTSCNTSFANPCSSEHTGSHKHGRVTIIRDMHDRALEIYPPDIKADVTCSNYTKSSCASEKVEEHVQHAAVLQPDINIWGDNDQKINCDAMSASNCKKIADSSKLNKKRIRPKESPRPRPKDRQMIQDRIKELREIIPNVGKCSIDALLEKTIRHMLFLQSVTKHADKLHDPGEPKICEKEEGLLLKDKFDGGATWACEVGSQSMVCPIIVEDLKTPGQMLIEMLCEDRGFFLEIADFIRGMGLTILRGVMEARKNKIWARFTVEANRDITRMEVFLALVKLFEPSAKSNLFSNVVNLEMPNALYYQSSVPATGSIDNIR